jgi:hypothetical protein
VCIGAGAGAWFFDRALLRDRSFITGLLFASSSA